MGTLFVVATPIGNLSDVSLRALEILRSVDMIACEDTRETKKLLEHFQIRKPITSFHQHSHPKKIDNIIQELQHSKNIALVCDAGTPGISDPGNKLVQRAVGAGVPVVPIPGPCAVIAALSVSGFPTDSFIFYGFLPHKKGKQKILKQIAENTFTTVFYESPYRILKTLDIMKNFLRPERKIVICRELTKKFESIYRGTVDETLQQLQQDKILGEFVVIVSPQT